MKISKFYFGPGSPKNRFLRFVRNFFTKKWAINLGITSETTLMYHGWVGKAEVHLGDGSLPLGKSLRG